MYLTTLPRYTLDGNEVETNIHLPSLKLPRLTRLYLFQSNYDLRGGTGEAFTQLVIDRMGQTITSLIKTIDFRGIEEFTYGEQLEGLMLLIRTNLEAIIIGLHGYNTIPSQSKKRQKPLENPYFAGIKKKEYPLLTSGVIFGTNMRAFIVRCFQDPRIREVIMDIIESQLFRGSEEQYSLLEERMSPLLLHFSYSKITGYDQADLYQIGRLVLTSCIKAYFGQHFVPLRQYLHKSLENKRIDLYRATLTDKRKINSLTSPCSYGVGEPLITDQKVERIITREWESSYYTWLNGEEDDVRTAESSTKFLIQDLHGNKQKELHKIIVCIFEEIIALLRRKLSQPLVQYKMEIRSYGNIHPENTIRRFIEERYKLPWNSIKCMQAFIQEFWQNRIRIIPLDTIDSSNETDEETHDESELYRVEIGEVNNELFEELLQLAKIELRKSSYSGWENE